MTVEEYERLRTAYAARGVVPDICCPIDGPPSPAFAWLGDLADRLFPGLCQEPEIEAEP